MFSVFLNRGATIIIGQMTTYILTKKMPQIDSILSSYGPSYNVFLLSLLSPPFLSHEFFMSTSCSLAFICIVCSVKFW